METMESFGEALKALQFKHYLASLLINRAGIEYPNRLSLAFLLLHARNIHIRGEQHWLGLSYANL